MDGAGALAAMAAPLTHAPASESAAPGPASASPWPIAFLEAGRKVVSGGGCRMLPPGAGWDGWLQSWVDFHYLDHTFDPARFPGRTLATQRSASYEDLIFALGRFHPPEDALFHAGLAWKSKAGPPPQAAFAAWLAALDEIFAYLDQARILTFTRKGWHGSVSVNRRIRERLVRRWDPQAAGGGSAGSDGNESFNGSPILILENDHAKGLFNGDVGVLLRLNGRAMAFFRRADAFLAFPAAFLPRHEPAFAMTVHKSQGSEYDQALVVLPESGNRLLYKETLYTALTRARYFAGIYGPAEVFLEAVARKVVRESGLPDYLGALMKA
jgi:ATP-dependent exoDNAse (exonuclease V) alpha subunit